MYPYVKSSFNSEVIDISQLKIDEQIDFLELCYDKCSIFMNDKEKWDKIAFISDTHGDFISELISILESGVAIIKKGEYTYYSIKDDIFLEDFNIKKYNYMDNYKSLLRTLATIKTEIESSIKNILYVYNDWLVKYIDGTREYHSLEDVLDCIGDNDKPLVKEITSYFYNNFKIIVNKHISTIESFKILKFFKYNNINPLNGNNVDALIKLLKTYNLNFNNEEIFLINNYVNNCFCVIPTPFINPDYNGSFFHLGDIVDRGKESLISLLFLEKLCEAYKNEYSNKELPIHIIIGNHEADDCRSKNAKVNKQNGAYAYDLYKPVIARMLHKGYISSGYLIKNNGNPILATHSIFSEHDVAMLFISFLNMHNVNNEYFERIKESIIREFNNKESKNLYDKIYNFIFNENMDLFGLVAYSDFSIEDELIKNILNNIKKTFSVEEMIQLRTIMLDGMLKTNINNQGNLINDKIIASKYGYYDDENNFIGIMYNLYTDNPIGFWQRFSKMYKENNIICNQCIGHESNFLSVLSCSCTDLSNKKRIVNDFDACRSYGVYPYNTFKSSKEPDKIFDNKIFTKAITTYYKNTKNIDLSNIYKQSSYILERPSNGVGLNKDAQIQKFISYVRFCNCRNFILSKTDKYFDQNLNNDVEEYDFIEKQQIKSNLARSLEEYKSDNIEKDNKQNSKDNYFQEKYKQNNNMELQKTGHNILKSFL